MEAAFLGLIEDHGAEDVSPFCLAAPATDAVPSLLRDLRRALELSVTPFDVSTHQ
jgi:hypothetical protein